MNKLFVIAVLGFIASSFAIKPIEFGENPFQQRHFPEWVNRVPISNGWTEANIAVPSDAEMHLTIALKIRNADQLEAKFWSVSDPDNADYGKYMSLQQLADLIAPSASDIAVVRSWLNSHGITSIETVVTKDYLTVVAPVSVVEKMFEVEVRYFKNINRKSETMLLRSVVPYSIPKHLSNVIDVVFGLTSFPASRPVIEMSKRAVQQFGPSVDPNVVKKTMHIGNFNGTGRTDNIQAVAQFLEQYYAPSDLSGFFQYYNLPNTKVTKVIGPNDPTNPGVEASLDIEYIMGTATGVQTWFYYTAGRHEQQEPFLQWIVSVNNQAVTPTVTSVSYGDYENSLSTSYMTKCNVEFAKAGVRGMTLLFASGDSGVGCDNSCAVFVPNWPASSPYVTSVGGVMLDSTSPFQVEGDSISSGGFSNVFSTPTYQTQAVQNYLKTQASNLPPATFYNVTGRAMPDIAAYSENVQVLVGGGWSPVAGTSCASPIAAGVMSLINEALLAKGKPTLGFINPMIYKIAASNSKAFYDVTTGSNPDGCCPGFQCAPGWDAVTGLGMPMFAELRDAVFKYLNIN
jgi:tripeptidyl-peptidase-1